MNTIALTVIFGVTFVVLLQILLWIYSHLSLRKKLASIPGPETLPFIGIIQSIRKIPTADLYEYMTDLLFQYKNGMVLIWFGTFPAIHIRKPHQMEVILHSQTLIRKSESYEFLAHWLGNGLLTSTGDMWHRNRRLITPAFHFNILDDFSGMIIDKADIFNDCIKSQLEESPDKSINIFPLAIKFTLDAVCETVMGVNMDMQRKPLNEYVKALHRFAELTVHRQFQVWYESDLIYDLFGQGKEYRECIKTMHAFTIMIINEKSKVRKENKKKLEDEIKSSDEDIDLSDADENPLTSKEIREQVDTFMFAGHDTTGIAISWALFCLGNEPDIQKKVHGEIDQVFGDNDEPATKSQLAQLKYLDRIIKEALRLYPSAPTISRLLDHDATIDNYTIPKGVEVVMQILHLHRDPEVWKDPTKFDPDRFLPENSHGRHPYAYLPFSAGPRNCIGQKFAVLVLKIALTSILRNWIIKSILKPAEVKLNVQIVLTPHNETLSLHFEPRRK